MKSMIKLPAMILGLLLMVTGLTQNVMAQEDDISLETFYEELAPYGRWTQDAQYGYVWRPDVDQRTFRPYYTDGHWTMTDYGNTWVSDYEWGWGPFHYGRWVLDRYDQWIWIPDTIWGPAWVSWRSGDGYYGWAPLGPDYRHINNGIGYNAPLNWWVFIPQINIYSSNYPRYAFRDQNFYNRTTFINYTYPGSGSRYYYTGPRADDIRRVTRRDVTVYRITPANRPGRSTIVNNNINIYRPRGGSGGRNSNNNSNVAQPGNNNRPGDRERGRDRRNNTAAVPNQPNSPAVTERNNTNGGRGTVGYTPTQDNTRVRGQRPSSPDRDAANRADQQRQVQDLEQRQQQMQRRQRDAQFDQQRQQRRSQRDQQMEQGQRQQIDQQRQQQMQQQRQQQDQQRQQQIQQQRQQQDQQRQQQMQQQRQQQEQQRQQQMQQQRQQQDQQRQQQMQQQRQQQEQQRQQQQRPASEPSRSGRGGRGN